MIDASRYTSWIALQQRHAVGHRPLERLATRDQALATGSLVDDRCPDRGRQIAVALALAAAVDQTDPAHVAVDDLPASEVDGMVGGQLLVHQLIGLAVELSPSALRAL